MNATLPLSVHPLVLVALAAGAVLLLRALARTARRAGRRVVRRTRRRAGRAVRRAVAYVILGRWIRRDRPVLRPVLDGDDIYRTCPLSNWTGDLTACRWCGGPLPTRSKRWCTPQCRTTARSNHEFGLARDAALARDSYRCVTCGSGATHEYALEVNHRTACLGRHGTPGCWHHLDGLETLCRTHHLQVTASQRRAGVFR